MSNPKPIHFKQSYLPSVICGRVVEDGHQDGGHRHPPSDYVVGFQPCKYSRILIETVYKFDTSHQ